jgi:hypothetical protein
VFTFGQVRLRQVEHDFHRLSGGGRVAPDAVDQQVDGRGRVAPPAARRCAHHVVRIDQDAPWP